MTVLELSPDEKTAEERAPEVYWLQCDTLGVGAWSEKAAAFLYREHAEQILPGCEVAYPGHAISVAQGTTKKLEEAILKFAHLGKEGEQIAEVILVASITREEDGCFTPLVVDRWPFSVDAREAVA
ncbi:MAG: hypothetical protein ACAH17_01610 [Candidatus Paceibacterota bacterium]